MIDFRTTFDCILLHCYFYKLINILISSNFICSSATLLGVNAFVKFFKIIIVVAKNK